MDKITLNRHDIREIVEKALNEAMSQNETAQYGTDSSNDIEVIGEFVSTFDSDLHYVAEDRIGNYESFTVFVYPLDNGNTPHVHIVLTKEIKITKKSFDCCIQLETNEYFRHGIHQSTMNSRQCRDFNNFMHDGKPTRKGCYTYYEYAVEKWDENIARRKVKTQEDENGELIIPDYSTIS